MRVSRFRIQNYKVIDDTDWIPVDRNVTALLGRNESGKTAILRALWKSRNVAGEQFDRLNDYPRARYSRDRKGTQEVSAIEFLLDSSESAEVAQLFPYPLDEPPTKIILAASYVGEDETKTAIQFEESIETRCRRGIDESRKAVEALAKALVKRAGAGDTTVSDAAQAALRSMDPAQVSWAKVNREAIEAFKDTIDSWITAAAERTPLAATERQKLNDIVAEVQKGDPAGRAREWAKGHLPVFIYFDDYGQLETRIHLPTYLRQSKEIHAVPKVRTQRALFKWSGIDPQEILDLGRAKQPEEEEDAVQRRLDKRRTLLQSASASLTGNWMDWWIPETKHKLHISADGEYLVLNVSDTKNEFEIPFEERSHGFQWFFSFYLVFLVESEEAHADAILLLDEPGLHLHPTVQSKLIGFFERVARTNQIVYSTHLPFLVDGDHVERIRTVYTSNDTPPRTVVSTDLRAGGDRDTLFPIQAAVGYSIAQTLFLGTRSVIVEGITDYIILKGLNSCLVALGREPRLHADTVLVPAGGTSKLMPLASIMFATSGVEGNRMLVLLDSDTEGSRAAAGLDEKLFGSDSRVVMLGEGIARVEATIEDVATRAEYIAAVEDALGKAVTLDVDETAATMTIGALSKYWQRMGWGRFGVEEKAKTALKLVETWTANPDRVPGETLDRASALVATINGRFE